MKYEILLVDDEPAVLSSLKRELRKAPFTVSTVNNVAEALAYLETNHPALVISDHKMPERDGLSLLCEVKKRWPKIVRVMLSGYTDMGILVEAINEAEIFRFIAKPWEKDVLIRIIHEAVEKYTLQEDNL